MLLLSAWSGHGLGAHKEHVGGPRPQAGDPPDVFCKVSLTLVLTLSGLWLGTSPALKAQSPARLSPPSGHRAEGRKMAGG